MDFIIIAALALLVVWFLLGAESKLKAWFKLQFKQLSDMPRIDETVQKTLGNTKN